jgi:hypothetical protein
MCNDVRIILAMYSEAVACMRHNMCTADHNTPSMLYPACISCELHYFLPSSYHVSCMSTLLQQHLPLKPCIFATYQRVQRLPFMPVQVIRHCTYSALPV